MNRLLVKKVKAFYQSVKLEFQSKEMEQDYRALKEQNMIRDFKICLIFVMFFNFITIVIAAPVNSWTEAYISLGTVVVLAPVYYLRQKLVKYIQFVTLAIIISYQTSRLLIIKSIFSDAASTRLFYSGYGLATMQVILLFRLLKVSQQAFGIIILIIMRFTFISLELSPGSFSINLFIKHFIIDAYVIYTFYNHDYVLRRIYENFVSKKEELLKFKEMIAESMPQSLVVVTYASNDLLFSNKSFQRIFGASDTSKQLKKDLESLVVDHSTIRDTDSNNKSFSASIESDAPLSLTETLEKLSSNNYLSDKTISLTASTTQNKGRRLFEVTLKKVKWDSEDAIAVFFNDITYQENLIALKLANVNKDRVIATVSHELRTPLNGIIGILDITEKKVEDPQVARYLSLCKDNAYLLLSLVNSILDFHQISADKLKLNPINLNVNKIISSIAQLFYFQCKEKNISFEYEIHQDVPARIFTDENRFKQVLINLVANAIKFTQKGGVKLEVIPHPRNPDSLQVSVTDTGIGIKTEDQKRLFKMYSRIEDGESVNKNGVGLGLTISNALAIMLNDGLEGRGIEVDSEHGKGSRFYFEIQKNLKEKEKKKVLPTKNETTKEIKKPLIVTLNNSDTARGLLAQNNNICDELKTEEAHLDSEDNCQDDYTESLMPLDLHSKLANYISPMMLDTRTASKHGTTNLQPEEGKDQGRIQLGDTLNFTNRHKSESGMAAIKTNLNILIVDDNPFNLLVAKSLFQEFGCNIVTALGGQEAINLVVESCSEGKPFEVIFMDCQMPIMDGFETTKELKIMTEKGEIPEVSIFGWTANNSEEDVKRCYEAGMIGHLPKPSSKMDFLKAISQL